MAFSSTRLFWPSRYRFPIFSVSGAGGNAEQQMRRTRLDPGLATRAAAEGDVLRAATCTNIVYKTGGVVKIGWGLLALWMLLTGCTGSGGVVQDLGSVWRRATVHGGTASATSSTYKHPLGGMHVCAAHNACTSRYAYVPQQLCKHRM